MTETMSDERRRGLEAVIERLLAANRVVLTTHVNADGDGTGSEVALAAWLRSRGVDATIINPTTFPAGFEFLLDADGAARDMVVEPTTDAGIRALQAADVIAVLDTGEPARIGRIARSLQGHDVVVIDHHPPGGDPIRGVAVRDPEACATAELIFDLLHVANATDAEWSDAVLQGVYTGMVTDTGSFRFSNTTPRTHTVVAELVARGIEPEIMYARLYNVPLKRALLLREALQTLEFDEQYGIASITVPAEAVERLEAGPEDMDGLIDHARSIDGTRVALLFRQSAGGTKVSLRSTGDVDVNAIARQFGGGGHVKAAGALIGGALRQNRELVTDAVREAIGRARNDRGSA